VKTVLQCVLASGSGFVRLVNSKGVDCAYRDNLMYSYAAAAVEDGGRSVDGFDIACTREPDGLDMERLARSAVDKALARCGARTVPSGQYPVILEHGAAADLLECFCGMFCADSVQKGYSRLAGREGEAIASDKVTLMDDPTLACLSAEAAKAARGFAGQPFDGEGVPARAKAVIEKGRLATLLHNLTTAAKAGTQSTGNASRSSYKSTVGVAPTNLYILSGEDSLEAMMRKMGDGLVIDDLSGLHAGANGVSGDFSLLAQGYQVKEGKRAGAVEQITVAGNFYELLNRIVSVGSDLTFGLPGSSCVGSPSLWIQSLDIAGE
ncbi:MAG: TldD/PmbA family protein, partial [Christensenellaceae bacterium]